MMCDRFFAFLAALYSACGKIIGATVSAGRTAIHSAIMPSANASALAAAMILLPATLFSADLDVKFHNAPASAQAAKNPYAGQEEAAQAGKQLYTSHCQSCHAGGQGNAIAPSLVDGKLRSVRQGEVFWFITRGDKDNGMPAWASLPAKQRWQIVTYIESLRTSQAAQAASSPEAIAPPPSDLNASKVRAPPPTPPFTDFRYENPGTSRKITVSDLPQPYATKSRFNSPDLV